MANSETQINEYISGFTDWRGSLLANLRQIILETDPEIKEEWKWAVPVFTNNKMLCAISAFKDHVKINFFKGAFLKDTDELFNNGFTSKQHRAIDFSENDKVNEPALQELIKQAVEFNRK